MKRALISMAVVAALLAGATAQAADTAPKAKGVQAITKPSKDVTVSFVRPGRITEVLVAKAQEVKAEQLIARQDEVEEQALLAQDKLKSEDTTAIEAEEKVHAQKVIDHKRMENSGAATAFEKDNAKIEVEVAAARVKIAKTNHEMDILKYKEHLIAVEKLKLTAPISGVVAEEFLQAGESAEGGNMKLVRIVQLDPLWADVPVPFLDARKLSPGDPAQVTFSDKKVRPAKVKWIAPTGDAASGTLLVRVEIPNPEKLSSDEEVFVHFGPVGVAKP